MLLTEIRWHGRAGQGVVTASRMFGQAALLDGKHAQAFPEFGPERAGAPVLGFTRVSDESITIHSQIYNPGVVVVLDPTLLRTVNVCDGLAKGGAIIINTDRKPEELRKELGVKNAQTYTVNATKIALEELGRPVFSTAMLGALAKVAPVTSLDSVLKVISERFPGEVGKRNVEAIKRAYKEVVGG